MIFQYQASRADKQIVQGVVEAASDTLAEQALYEAGFQYVLSLRGKPEPQPLYKIIPSIFGVKQQEVIDLINYLASFMESGSSLVVSLQLVLDQLEKPSLKDVVSGLIKEVQDGKPFSRALQKYPDIFPPSFWQVIEASERSGDLESGLRQVSEYMDSQLRTANKIKKALAYPAFVTLMAAAAFVMMITIVLPPMVRLFESFHSTLPPATLFLISMTDFFTNQKFIIIAVVLILVILGYALTKFPFGQRFLDRMMYRIPIVGTIILQRQLGKFCRTCSMLLKAGLQLPEAVEAAMKASTTNTVFIDALSRVKVKLLQGEGLAAPMKESHLFPSMMVRLLSTAEQTGTIDSAFSTLAGYFETRTDQKIRTLITWIEPSLTIFIGMAVAFLLLAIMLPMYSIMKTIH